MLLRALVDGLDPVHPDTRRALGRAWERVPPHYRTPQQFLGRQYAGCGALIGAMPRCDFACRGCYLGEDANRVPAASVAEIERQLGQLRAWLGEGGGVQITDGEVTLRDPDELVRIIAHARSLGLIPMLFTHGDGVLRDPGLLRRLMVEGGLGEISIHVDTTQRGRRDRRYRSPSGERDLDPLRDAFANLIRRVRAETGLPLHAATTVTVTPENLDGVRDVMRWVVRNADAFKMVSFQPVAQVGRTQDGLGGGVSVEALWRRIGEVLDPRDVAETALSDHRGWLGHPECSQFVQGIVRHSSERTRFTPLLDSASAAEVAALERVFEALGGLTFRVGGRADRLRRGLQALLGEPRAVLGGALPWLWRVAGRLAPEGRARAAWRWRRGGERVSYLNVVSHHFMSAEEIATPRGKERLELCAFQVPIGERMVSMCEVNALGERERFYADLRSGAGR